MNTTQIARLLDHSVLHPSATDAEMRQGAQIALQYQTAALCIKPYFVPEAAILLQGSSVKVCCVVGFPHGNSATAVKVFETERACLEGATEVDMVVNVGKVLQRDWSFAEREIGNVLAVTRKHGAILKVIFETGFLTDEFKIRLCEICTRLQVDFVKTSTGFGYAKETSGYFTPTGATLHDVRLLRQHTPATIEVKASGGIRTLADVLQFHQAGATRIGTSATESILSGQEGLTGLENY